MGDIKKNTGRGRAQHEKPKSPAEIAAENKALTSGSTAGPTDESTQPEGQKKTGRGRPSSTNNEASEARVAKEQGSKRAPRIPMARAKKLDVKQKPGYYRHWFNQSNVAKAEAAYYDFVTDEEGAKVTRPAGNGETRLYLMEIKEEFYKEDVELARQNINDVLQDKVQGLRDGEYIPEGQNNPMVVE